jgi:hypothetical protein
LNRNIALGHSPPLSQFNAQAIRPQHRAAQPHLHIAFCLEDFRPLIEGLPVRTQP